MNLSFGLRQELICATCGNSTEDHLAHCPERALARLVAEKRTWNCPACIRTNTVEVNSDDFFECRRCAARYTSAAEHGPPTDDERRYILVNIDRNEGLVVRRLKGGGRGDFAIDATVKLLTEQGKALRKARREG